MSLYNEAATPGSTFPGAGMANTGQNEGYGSFIRVPPLQLPFNVAYQTPPQFQRVSGLPHISVHTPAPPASGGMSAGSVSIPDGITEAINHVRPSRWPTIPVGLRKRAVDLMPQGLQDALVRRLHRASVSNVTPNRPTNTSAGTR